MVAILPENVKKIISPRRFKTCTINTMVAVLPENVIKNN
jgi:hypothetical protein